MAKKIRLTETDIVNITKKVKQIMAEQEDLGIKPFPKPEERNITPFPEKKPAENMEMKKKYQTQEDILRLKRVVKARLVNAKDDLDNLIILSGVNPDGNDLSPLLDKLIVKFDALFGDPKPAEDIDEQK